MNKFDKIDFEQQLQQQQQLIDLHQQLRVALQEKIKHDTQVKCSFCTELAEDNPNDFYLTCANHRQLAQQETEDFFKKNPKFMEWSGTTKKNTHTHRQIDVADTKIRLWYIERKIESETAQHRQLTERCAAQEKEIETNFNEALQRFSALLARMDNIIERIGKERIHPEELAIITEIRRQYDAKFCEDGQQERVRERKAFAYATLKHYCEVIGKRA